MSTKRSDSERARLARVERELAAERARREQLERILRERGAVLRPGSLHRAMFGERHAVHPFPV